MPLSQRGVFHDALYSECENLVEMYHLLSPSQVMQRRPPPRQDEVGKESPKSRSCSRQQMSLDLKDIRTPGVRRRGQTGTGVVAGAQAYLAVSLAHSMSHGDEFCSGKGNLSKNIKYQRFIISDVVCTSFQRSYRPRFQTGCWLRSLRAVTWV